MAVLAGLVLALGAAYWLMREHDDGAEGAAGRGKPGDVRPGAA